MNFKTLTFALALSVASGQQMASPLKDVAIRVHNDFVNFWRAPADTEYNFGYNVTDSRNGNVVTQYESRHGDVAYGSYKLVDRDGVGNAIFYSVDDAKNQGVELRHEDVVGRLIRIDRRPLLNRATPTQGQEALSLQDIDTLRSGAKLAHGGFLASFTAEAPTRYEMEYEMVDPTGGTHRSQTESMHDDAAVGSCSVTEGGGPTKVIHYTITGDTEIVLRDAFATVATL